MKKKPQRKTAARKRRDSEWKHIKRVLKPIILSSMRLGGLGWRADALVQALANEYKLGPTHRMQLVDLLAHLEEQMMPKPDARLHPTSYAEALRLRAELLRPSPQVPRRNAIPFGGSVCDVNEARANLGLPPLTLDSGVKPIT